MGKVGTSPGAQGFCGVKGAQENREDWSQTS